MKALGKLSNSLALPALALIALVSIGIIDSTLPTSLYWSLLVAVLIVLVVWQITFRIRFASAVHAVVLEDQMVAARPYATAYAIVCLGLVAAMACPRYFEISPTFLIAGIAAWFLRRDLWAAMILRGLDRIDKLISAPRSP